MILKVWENCNQLSITLLSYHYYLSILSYWKFKENQKRSRNYATKGTPNAQTKATEKYQKKAGLNQ